jgi:hypothetical protein
MAATSGWRVVAFCVLLVVPMGVAGAAGGGSLDAARGAGGPASQAGLASALQQSIDADTMRLTVALDERGGATWTVEYRVRLETDNETAAFESLQDDIRTNRSAYVERFAARIRATVGDAENATGRGMAARNFSVSSEVRNLPNPSTPSGVVTYRFHWEGFAAMRGSEIRAGDAVGGLFLTESQSLEMTWPETFDRQRAVPIPTRESETGVVWEGPLSFGPDGPTLVVVPEGGFTTPVLVAVAITLAVLVLVGAWVYREDSGDKGFEERSLDDDEEGAADPAGDGDDGAGGEEEDDTGPPEELLSNEERVLQLLEREGGRIKQQAVVEEFDWTAAKTSQVVNGMKEEGQIDVFRLGRENVLKLPDQDLTDEGDE